MVFKIKSDKVDELKNGRTNRAISERVGVREEYLSSIFKRKKNCTQPLAIMLILVCKGFKIEENKLQEILEYFFEKIEK